MAKNKTQITFRQVKDDAVSSLRLQDTLNTYFVSGHTEIDITHADAEKIGLPIAACGEEHYLKAQLFVTVNGSSDRMQGTKLVGQIIIITGCVTNRTQLFSRTGRLATNACTWSKWTRVVNDNDIEGRVAQDVTWGEESDVNRFVNAGIFNIAGVRNSDRDGLPLWNYADWHQIHARLVVLDSSSGSTGGEHDKCVTQILTLSNRHAGDGDVYVRTGRASMKNQLAAGIGWEPWGRLQQNVQVGQVASLDSYIDNGMYSGVFTNGTTVFETFVMVVINNYQVASEVGQTRSVSQFKYALATDGTFSYKTRAGQGNSNISWGEWVDLGAASTGDIQDNSITAAKLSMDVRETVNKVPTLEANAAIEKAALLNGDTIVGMAREVYSRQGKVDTATFLKRTTAGSTSISDGVASVKQIGGNIVKNLVDGTFASGWIKDSSAIFSLKNGIYKVENSASYRGLRYIPNYVLTHKYYISVSILSNTAVLVQGSGDGMASTYYNSFNNWGIVSSVWSGAEFNQFKISASEVGAVSYVAAPLLIDLTEMYGEGNEPTKEECDRMFAAVGALPQGLTVAQCPTALKSTGFNQWNPNNVIAGKTVSDGALVDSTEYNIAVVECLPCKTGAGENNGYVIGYGEGDTWSDDGIEVYLTPLNPLEVQGELYLCKLEKDATYNTYVPQISGYMLVVTPVTEKFCAHLHWSGDRERTDYEEYIESEVTLPVIPEMSEWRLAGLFSDRTTMQDTIDLENNKYTKRIGQIDLGQSTGSIIAGLYSIRIDDMITNTYGKPFILCKEYTTVARSGMINHGVNVISVNTSSKDVQVYNPSCSTAEEYKAALQGVMLYYILETPEEYPIVTKAAPSYIGSDYGVEKFVGSEVPLAANILFYMRSLVSETRNFLDRLMAGLGTSDVTAAADKIIAAVAGNDDETESQLQEE